MYSTAIHGGTLWFSQKIGHKAFSTGKYCLKGNKNELGTCSFRLESVPQEVPCIKQIAAISANKYIKYSGLGLQRSLRGILTSETWTQTFFRASWKKEACIS